MRGLSIITLDELQRYDVNVEGQPVVTWQPIWDYQAYPNAGFTGQRLFFQEPIGTNDKTLEDTNLRSQGRLSTPVNMLITGIEAVFWPGVDPWLSTLVAQDVGDSIANDLYAVHNGEMSFRFQIGDKVWLEEGPLGVFPTQFWLDGFGAVHYTQAAAASATVKGDYASFRGPMYQITPFRLISNQEFSVLVNSPAAIALPSGVDARWGFRLHGYRFSLAQ